MPKTTARDELLAFGYAEVTVALDETHTVTGLRRGGILWVPVEGGYHRYHREGDVWKPLPHHAEPATVEVDGQTVEYIRHVWLYPEDWMQAEYANGNANRAAGYPQE